MINPTSVFFIISISATVLFVPQSALSHSGRTNSEGCHNNRKTGDYHCHNSGKSSTSRTKSSSSSQYNRKSWPHWTDEDGDCQNTRAEILIRDSTTSVKFKRNRGCNVSWGRWVGPYSGQVFTKASDIDIDHIVPLSHAHKTGGAGWTRSQKRQFANDPQNLLAVDDSTNQSKGGKSPARWKPPQKAYWCTYATRWRGIKRKYGLTVSVPEERSLRVMERECRTPH